jgi:hypothetical protein
MFHSIATSWNLSLHNMGDVKAHTLTHAVLAHSTYTYTVGRKQSAIAIDVVGAFAKEMKSNGIGCGFYYSLTNNFYLNVEGKVANEGTGLLKGQVPVNQVSAAPRARRVCCSCC